MTRKPTITEWKKAQLRLAQSKLVEKSVDCTEQLEILCHELEIITRRLTLAGAPSVAKEIMKVTKPALLSLDKYQKAAEELIFAQQNPNAKVN